MSATRAQARTAIATALKTLSGLHVYEFWDSNAVAPAALIKPTQSGPLQTLGNPNETTYEVALVAGTEAIGEAQGQKILDPYMEDTGSKSVQVVLLGPGLVLDNGVQVIDLTWGNYGQLDINGVIFIGAIFTLRVWR